MKNSNKDALLNEYKGSIFEFLVASALAKNFKLEALEKNLTKGDFQMLSQQESFVRNYYPDLLKKLPILAAKTAEQVHLSMGDLELEKVVLQGKQNNSIKSDFSEADILLVRKQENIPISLKLAKTGLPINTKSTGLRSFFHKYFNRADWQSELDQFVDLNFEMVARELHEFYDRDYLPQFKNWGELPKLPGELPLEAKELLHKYYEKVANFIFVRLKEIIKEPDFLSCIYPLVGFSDPKMIQVVTLYEKDYHLKDILIKNMQRVRVQTISHRKSTIQVGFDRFELHLRVKPMNTFTAKSYKVNAAIKY